MMKKLIAVLLLFVMTISCSIQAFAFTPRYSVSMPKIPDIHVELSDATKKAVDNAVKEQLEKTILERPVITQSTCWHGNYIYGTKTHLILGWNPVEDAQSYSVEITKADGTKKIYTAERNYMFLSEWTDDFITGCLNEKTDGSSGDATVRLRAHGENDTCRLWSEVVYICCNASY